MSVERGRRSDAIPAIVKLNHGELEVLDLSTIPHSRAAIPNEPDPCREAGIRQPARIRHHRRQVLPGAEVFVSGVSATSASPRPCTASRTRSHQASRPARSEIWHPVHGSSKTRAPIIRHLVREVGGEPYLFAV